VPSVEEAAEEGQNAAQSDSELPDARYQDLYAGFKTQMDEFFSLDGENDGFMDQFLLKYQGAKLAALISNLDLIIGGGTKGADEEGEARAFSTATQQADANLNEDQSGSISKKGQLELKTRLVAMLKGLKSLRSMMNSYKENATKSSANPSLDGSALKKSLERYMSNLQINIKAIVETCYIEHSKLTQTQSDDVDLNEPSGDELNQPTGDDTTQNDEDRQPETQQEQLYEAIMEAIAPALDGVYLMEDAAREEKMELVNTTYGAMLEIYESSMQSALEKAQKEIAMKNASQMMELAKKEEFIALFPTFTGSFGGKPQTIDSAVKAVDGLVKEFVETMKKVIVLAKGSTIDETTLSKVIEDLSMMSLMMQNYFGVKSLLDDDMQARVEKMLAQREENQSLSDDPKSSDERSGGGFMDKAKELAGKALEKLKQMFGWLGEETLKLLANLIDAPDLAKDPMFIKFVEPFGELVVKQGGELTAKSEGSPEVKQVEELMVKTLESKSWFDSLKPEQQSAVTELIDGIYKDKRMLQELDMSSMGTVPSEVRDQISSQYQMAMVLVLKKMDEEKQSLLTSLMSENEDEFVSYLVNQHELRQKMGEEKTKAIGELTLKTSGPGSSPSDVDGEVPEAETYRSIKWYQGLPEREQESAQAFALSFLNILRDSGKVPYLVKESVSDFSKNLTKIYAGEDADFDLVDEMNKALYSLDDSAKKTVIRLMQKQPDNFAKFVYDLTTKDAVGDKFFGSAPDHAEETPSSGEEKESKREEIRKKGIMDHISDEMGIQTFWSKLYLKDIGSDAYRNWESIERLDDDKKNDLVTWVVDLDKRIKESTVKEAKTHPADSFGLEFRLQLSRINKIEISSDDALSHANNAIPDATRNHWLGEIVDNKDQTASLLATLIYVHRNHGPVGLKQIIFQKPDASTSSEELLSSFEEITRKPMTDEEMEAIFADMDSDSSAPDGESGADEETIDSTLDADDDLRARSDLDGENEEEGEDEEGDNPWKSVGFPRSLYEPVLKTFTSGDKITDKKEVIGSIGRLARDLQFHFRPNPEVDEISEGLKDFAKGVKNKFSLRSLKKTLVDNKDVATKDGRKITPKIFDTKSFKGNLLNLKKFGMSDKNIVTLIKYLMKSKFNVKLARQNAVRDEEGGDRFQAALGPDRVAESLKPIIEKMLKEHYNH